MSTTLKKITAKAKQLRIKNKKLSWRDAVKKASIELRKDKKIPTQTGGSSIKADRRRKALPPGKRKSASGKIYYERRKNRSDVKGTLQGINEKQLIGAIKEKVNGTMGKAFIMLNEAKTKREKNEMKKIISECKKKLRKLK